MAFMTPTIPLSDLTVIGLDRTDQRAHLLEATGHPHPPCDGWTGGVADMNTSPPHGGERHPDGDEVLYVYDGSLTINLELGTGDQQYDVSAGHAFIVPRGTWHQVTPTPAAKLMFITPGPRQEHRPQ